ncbi:MAG TPA: hypothetical protein VFU99_05375 [Gaiellaceae bacterium]|nr:hypothetical protein [Gaiellaceae bacterium]
MPLSTLLSQVLVAHTIELDNEFERRFVQGGGGARVTSLVMWSNLLRFVGDGITVGDLQAVTGLQKARVLSTVGGVERWRYVELLGGGSSAGGVRDGFGSARGLRTDSVVRLTDAGRRAAEIWPELLREIESRWRARFGAADIDELAATLRDVVRSVEVDLPEYLPILGTANGMALDIPERKPRGSRRDLELVALLAQALMAYTLEFEAEAALSLALDANVLRVLDDDGVDARQVSRRAGISPEGTAMALTFLAKTDYVVVEGASRTTALVRSTTAGRDLRARHSALHAQIEDAWRARHGSEVVSRLSVLLGAVLEHPALADGLRPPPGGWRGSPKYRSRTEALIADPHAGLPHAPMVLHRGGWPDGS